MTIHLQSKTVHTLILKGAVFSIETEVLKELYKQDSIDPSEKAILEKLKDIEISSENGYILLQGKGHEDFETVDQFNSPYVARLKYENKELRDQVKSLMEQQDTQSE